MVGMILLPCFLSNCSNGWRNNWNCSRFGWQTGRRDDVFGWENTSPTKPFVAAKARMTLVWWKQAAEDSGKWLSSRSSSIKITVGLGDYPTHNRSSHTCGEWVKNGPAPENTLQSANSNMWAEINHLFFFFFLLALTIGERLWKH